MNNRYFIYLLLFVYTSIPTSVFAQLPDFQIQIISTSETCPGNGSATISSSGTDPAATLIYSIFKLTDTTNPVAVLTTGNIVEGLTSDNYLLIATQSLSGTSNTQQQTFSILNETSPLTFAATTTPAICGNNGSISIETYSGTAVSVEIISGPLLVSNQTELTISSLPSGVYSVRVFDNCNQGFVQTVTVLNTGALSLNSQTNGFQQLVTCNTVTIKNNLSFIEGTQLTYPYNATYTVYPPDGSAPFVVSTQVQSGDLSELQLSAVIPFYNAQTYYYDLVITDACSNISTFLNNLVDSNFKASLNRGTAPCGDYFINFAVTNFLPPVSINFIQYPAGFNPLNYVSTNPASFSNLPINYGSATNVVPFGQYKAIVKDACGRSLTVSKNIIYVTPIPKVTIIPLSGCESYKSNVTIKVTGYPLNTAIIQSGPPAFSLTYPVDVSNLISEGNFKINGLITGNYNIVLTDFCGNTYPLTFVVPPLATTLTVKVLPGCDLGKASLQITGNDTELVSVILNSVVPVNSVISPSNLSANISVSNPEIFSINNIPTGVYNFTVLDNCGITHTQNINIDGYSTTQNTYQIIPQCGSFNLELDHISNSGAPLFWLQKQNPTTGEWGHPGTNVVMANGSPPNDQNGFPLLNESITLNIGYSGDFRIIKLSQIFENGNVGSTQNCIEVIQEFSYSNILGIKQIEKTTCGGTISDVFITAEGTPPLQYKITTKDGLPFLIDNGNDNMFLNLSAGVYNFQVLDNCGSSVNMLADVSTLPTRLNIISVDSLNTFVQCDDSDNNGEAIFYLSDLESEVTATANPDNYTITFYSSLQQAISGVDPLPNEFLSDDTTLFIRIAFSNALNCYDITIVDLKVNPYPTATVDALKILCIGDNITLEGPVGFETYLWSTGETTETIEVSQAGTYSVTITKTTNNVVCNATYAIEVVNPEIPIISEIKIVDWTDDENSITVNLAQNQQNFIYSLDNINFQTSNMFSQLTEGEYTIYIKNIIGCDPNEYKAYLLNYPKFFTPNGDSYNDLWKIANSVFEPNMKIFIYDRYGKFLKNLDSESLGWDGMLNGKPLPSTDYWFVVIRENGMQKRGHFSIKR